MEGGNDYIGFFAIGNADFVVLHAARGESLSTWIKKAKTEKQKEELTHVFKEVGMILGNYYQFMSKEKTSSPEGMMTLTHNDLHPGNFFVDRVQEANKEENENARNKAKGYEGKWIEKHKEKEEKEKTETVSAAKTIQKN